ncbi:MAG: hypothetical protein AAGN64_05725 [Bacteroidota bacterium]
MLWAALSLSVTPTAPYAVSPRMKHAIDSLDLDAPRRVRVAIVSDAPSLQVFLKHCLDPAFEVVAVTAVRALAQTDIELLVADLYTLDHQTEPDLNLLSEAYRGIPLLIASQESVPGGRTRPAAVLGRPHATVLLPTSPTDLRRAAAALLGTSTSSPSL